MSLFIFQAPQPYSFSYNVVDDETYNDFNHSEKTDGKVTTGSYRVELPDGRTQIVTYRADENGYTAVVKYEGVAQYPEYVETKKYWKPFVLKPHVINYSLMCISGILYYSEISIVKIYGVSTFCGADLFVKSGKSGWVARVVEFCQI